MPQGEIPLRHRGSAAGRWQGKRTVAATEHVFIEQALSLRLNAAGNLSRSSVIKANSSRVPALDCFERTYFALESSGQWLFYSTKRGQGQKQPADPGGIATLNRRRQRRGLPISWSFCSELQPHNAHRPVSFIVFGSVEQSKFAVAFIDQSQRRANVFGPVCRTFWLDDDPSTRRPMDAVG